MSDPIADIPITTRWETDPHKEDLMPESAKQIRQQIGRELLDDSSIDSSDKWWVKRIREVCQLGKQE